MTESSLVETEIVLEARNLKKVYKDFWGRTKAIGVNGIDFRVSRGEVVGLLGPNGSGKTTTIKLILGLLRPGSGTIKIFDKNPDNHHIKRRIGYLPEDTYLYPYLTAEEILHYFGSLFQLPYLERKKRISQLLQMVGLGHASKRRLGEFSKGMARRIGLAQSLINDPDLIILDEPTSGLDPIGCREVKKLIRLLSRRKKTIMISSHLLADLEDVCDKILIIYNGKIYAQGSLSKLLTIKNKMRITLPALDEEIVKKITEICQTSAPPTEIVVDQPSIRLEEFFLSVINKARKTGKSKHESNPEHQLAQYLVESHTERPSAQPLEEWNDRYTNPDQPKSRSTSNGGRCPIPNLERLESLTEKGKLEEVKKDHQE